MAHLQNWSSLLKYIEILQKRIKKYKKEKEKETNKQTFLHPLCPFVDFVIFTIMKLPRILRHFQLKICTFRGVNFQLEMSQNSWKLHHSCMSCAVLLVRLSVLSTCQFVPFVLSVHLSDLSICPFVLSVHMSVCSICPFCPLVHSIHLYPKP